MFDTIELTQPNELGFQFGINESLTEWAHQEQNNWGNILPAVDITILEVWKDNERKAYLLIDEKTNEPIDEGFEYEDCAARIDKWKLIEKSKHYN